MNELQIRERDHLSNDNDIAQLTAVGPKAVTGRWRTPPPARYIPIPFGPPIGWTRGNYSQGVGGERVEIDALDFIRTSSSRIEGTGVLSNALPL
jgi:hypothetical protein